MKEKIYTIPVNDAFAAQCACPLCTLEETMTQNLVDYYLGAALMEPDVRMTTNEKGFCGRHFARLFNSEKNRLGLGLMMHTHTCDLIGDLIPKMKDSIPTGNAGLFKNRQKDFRQDILNVSRRISERADSCMICERLDYTMQRYVDVICHQYFTDEAFKTRFDEGHGYCQIHLAMLLKGAASHLNQNQASEFLQSLVKQQQESMETLRDDIEWFTLKFDYRNKDKDWKNSKDALPRGIRSLSGDTNLHET